MPNDILAVWAVLVVVAVVVIAIALARAAFVDDLLRASRELQDVHSRAVPVHDINVAAVVDFDVVGHVAIGNPGVGIGHRYIEPHFDRCLRLADIPYAQAAGKVRDRRQLAVERIPEILLARVRPEARSPRAVVAALVFFTETRIDRHRREHHGPLPLILFDGPADTGAHLRRRHRWKTGAGRTGLGVFDRDINHKTPMRRFLTQIGRRLRSQEHDVARLELGVLRVARGLQPEHRHRGMATLVWRHVENPRLRRKQVCFRGRVRGPGPSSAKRNRQQFLAIEDLHHAIIADAPRCIDPIADDVVGSRRARQLAGRIRMLVRGNGATVGVGLVEVFDLARGANSKLVNISTRGFVDTGDNVMIGGFIIGGANSRVIVRGIGPSLPVSGTLQDPTLELHDGNGAIFASNDNWKESQEAEIEATGLAPTNDAESAITALLEPGSYTAVLRGKDDTTGVALIELYSLN